MTKEINEWSQLTQHGVDLVEVGEAFFDAAALLRQEHINVLHWNKFRSYQNNIVINGNQARDHNTRYRRRPDSWAAETCDASTVSYRCAPRWATQG